MGFGTAHFWETVVYSGITRLCAGEWTIVNETDILALAKLMRWKVFFTKKPVGSSFMLGTARLRPISNY